MKSIATVAARRRIVATLSTLTFATAVIVFAAQFHTPTSTRAAATGLVTVTRSHSDHLPNYDIRTDSGALEKLSDYRQLQNRAASAVADIRDRFVLGEKALARQVPTLKIVYNSDIKIPEVIGIDAAKGRAFLTPASRRDRAEILADFLRENRDLIGVSNREISELRLFANYTNPDGKLSFVEFNQVINGVPVFRGEIKAAFTERGELGRVINNLAPGLENANVATDFGDAAAAVRFAAANINHDLKPEETVVNKDASTGLRSVFGSGDWATTAEKMYFPTEPGVAVPAWRVLIWQPVNAFYVLVDAKNGTVLWRKNLTEDQAQPATYQVYVNPNAMINVADSPAPLTPYVSPNFSPADGAQGVLLDRTNVARIGNEAPYLFNTNGWINDGANTTDGNALESGIDRDGTNGVDPGSPATGNPARTFSSLWNPPPGNPPPGDSPLTPEAQRGAVIQQFYIMNWYHDELYRLGFTELARNYQHDNFGRGGAGGDRISAEGQDSSGTNNANFSSGADGTRGRMQMYLWTGPNPDRDGTGDADIMIHEVTHGTSNRLHGNNSGLTLNLSRAMGEGWSDFYAHCLLSEPSDSLNGIHSLSGYALFQAFGAVGNASYYYGIRRFPKAIMSSTGGPMNRPHNPLTFADIDQTQLNTSDGAFAAMSGPHISASADQVHAAGEVWSSALWEVRGKLIARLGWAEGNRRVLQYVTDGMKLAPIGPTFLTERDAILAAALMSGDDVADIWAGFAIRGMGASATIQNPGTGGGSARVTEAFDLPNLAQTPAITITDASGNNNGFPDPGESILVQVPLTNITGRTATGVTAQIVGGGTGNYGTIGHNASATQSIPFTVPANTVCGSVLPLTINVSSSLGPVSFQKIIAIGVPVQTFTENFDSATPPAFPAGWTVNSSYVPMTWGSNASNPDTAPNSAFAADLPDCTGTSCPPTNGGETLLDSPSIPITAQAATVSFRHRYNTEDGWDGGVLEISISSGTFTDIIAAGGSFLANGYNGSMGVSNPNPLGGRNGWTGDSGGYITTVARLPAAAAGQSVRLRWRFGTDNNTAPVGGGWHVDTVKVFGNYSCGAPLTFVRPRADFDGDGKTDISVFRPSEGNWYLNQSLSGFQVRHWGLSTDIPAPGDFDGDNRADATIFRPSDGTWWILRTTGGFSTTQFGLSGDIPVVGDYNIDGRDDIAVFRPSTNVWYIQLNAGGVQILQFGAAGDLPVRGDYDGDGRTDIAIFRPSSGTWWIAQSTVGLKVVMFGLAGDKPVPADYDGDGKEDVAIYRPSSGLWYIQRSSTQAVEIVSFGIATDLPVPGDYDGDGKDDQAIYRNGAWWLNRSTAGVTVQSFGLSTDTAIPATYIP